MNDRYSGTQAAINDAYQQERLMSEMYEFIVGKFLEKEAAGELTRAELARRTSKTPAQITRWLSTPSNWTLSTIASLLLAISDEKLIPKSEPIARTWPQRNFKPIDLLDEGAAKIIHAGPMHGITTEASTASAGDTLEAHAE